MLLALCQRAATVITRQYSCYRLHTSSSQLTPALILEDWQHGLKDQQLPRPVWECLLAIRQAGHDAYLVGGTVRDLLLHKAPRDYDLLTTANLQQCRRLLGGSIVGRRHPVCLVQLPGATVEASSLQSNDRTSAAAGQHQPLDAAALTLLIHQTPSAAAAATGPHAGWTLPATWSYSQARRQDALRRDFTANALLYDPFSRLLFDYVGGWQDMQQRVVRCVGDPSSSFQADPSRMLRALRCASRAGFQLEAGTAAALQKHKELLLTHTTPARLRQEVQRLLCHGAAAPAVQLLQDHGLMELLLPKHHQYLQCCQQHREAPLLLPALSALDECFTSSRLQQVPPHVLLAVLVAPLMVQQLHAAAQQLADHAQCGSDSSQLITPMGHISQGQGLAAAMAAGEPLQGLLMGVALTCIEQVVTSAPCTADGTQHPDHNPLAVAHPEHAAGLLLAAWRHQSRAKQRPQAPQDRQNQDSGGQRTTLSGLLPSVASPGASLLQALVPAGTVQQTDMAAARKLLRRLARKRAGGEWQGRLGASSEPDEAGLTCRVLDQAGMLLTALNKHARC